MKLSRVLTIFIVLVLLFTVVGGFFWWSNGLSAVNPAEKEKSSFVITKGESVAEISLRLKGEGLIKSPASFRILVFIKGYSKKIQAGNFYLSPSMTAEEVVKTLTKGTNDLRITIIEGLRSEEIGQFLLAQGLPIDLIKWNAGIKSQDLEGKLFPDTYAFPKNASQEAILKIINKNFSTKIENELKGVENKESFSLKQILTFASIVEKEARTDNDKKMVAGILIKRWKNDWPLQADAAVQYAVANVKCKITNTKCDWWPKSLTAKDLQINSPYNTYLNKSLPPGAICNPGLDSIKAVLSPQDSPYWFYLSDPKGVIHYAKTDQEQAENISNYLR